MASTRLVRVLLTSTPGLGHLQALMPLALALRAAGHDVMWATAPQSCQHIADRGFAVEPAGMNVVDRRAAFASKLPDVMSLPPRRRRSRLFTGYFADAAAPKMLVELGPIFDRFRPHVIVHEMGELAAAPMAIARGVPHVTVAFSGSLPDDAISPLIESISPVWAAEKAGSPTWEQLLGDLYLHPFPASLGASPGLEIVRPTRTTGRTSTTSEVPEWLEPFGRERPGVYITSGTEPTALQAPWNALFAAVGALSVDVVATIGPFVDTDALGTIPQNVRVERFVPHDAVLDRSSIVASHGGAGTMLASAAHGLPQLVFPMFADQWGNADAIAGAGAALVCESDNRSSAEIGSMIERLLDDASFRHAAAVVAAEIDDMPAAADRVGEIVHLANA